MRAELTKPGGNDSARKGNVRPFVGGGLNARVVIEITVAMNNEKEKRERGRGRKGRVPLCTTTSHTFRVGPNERTNGRMDERTNVQVMKQLALFMRWRRRRRRRRRTREQRR